MIAPAAATALVAAALVAPAAGAPASAGVPVALCRPGGDDGARTSARKAIAAIDGVVRRRGATLGELKAAVARLEAEPCLAHTEGRLPSPESVIAFRDWWRGGGQRWLGQQIVPTRELLVPPDVRPTLTAELVSETLRTRLGRALPAFPAPLLCPDQEMACDAEAAGWIVAAETALAARPGPVAKPVAGDDERCRDVAGKFPPPQRYRAFVECASLDSRGEVPRFPAGTFRGPRAGWLVVRSPSMAVAAAGESPRGYGLAAYHLESGAAYQAVLDVTAANQAVVRAGRVPPRLARQTLFLVSFRDRVPDGQARWRRFQVPDDIELVWWKDPAFVLSLPRLLYKKHGTQLGWAWVDRAPVATGTVTFERGGSAFDGHVEQMLDRLSTALVEGCAPQRPPADLAAQAPPAPVDRLGPAVTPERERALADRHEKAWREALARPLCGR